MKLIRLKVVISAVALVLVIFSCKKQEKEKSNKFTITVTGGEHFPEGSRVAVYRSDTIEKPGRIEFLKVEKFTNGKFTYKGTVNDVHSIIVDVIEPDSDYPFNRIRLPLEPENIKIDYSGHKEYTFKGGKYGELLVNSLNTNQEFKESVKKLIKYGETTDFDDSLQVEKYLDFNRKVSSLEQKILEGVLEKNKDPLLKMLAFEVGYNVGPEVNKSELIEKLAKEVGLKHRQSKVSLLNTRLAKEREEARANVGGIGSIIKDFEAKNIQGETIHLVDVLKENKYVLVEFWASWCGPCRGEIPHMKKAYKEYKSKGFEIISFSLDHKKEDWKVASNEEKIPWINTSDLLAYTSPVAKIYGVNGVPANYLVEGSTGTIVAKDLRQEKLDEKLAELLK